MKCADFSLVRLHCRQEQQQGLKNLGDVSLHNTIGIFRESCTG